MPYVPGLLSFRELPVLLSAFARLRYVPQAVLCDGQGRAHPRRFGLASHLGVLLDIPSVGCAKSRLIGTYVEPGLMRGAQSPLHDRREVIGTVLRTRDHTRPLFISVGHRITLADAVWLTLQCGGGFRIPEPTRQADITVRKRASTLR
jgi:deoxyribonuclease V